MPEQRITFTVDGRAATALPGTNLAAWLVEAGLPTRTSVRGAARGPLCGMGTCYECRVTVAGVPHVRACTVLCTPGLVVETAATEVRDV